MSHSRKIFSSLPATDILLAVDGLHLDLTGLEVEVTLLLTPEILFVVSSEEDSQQQAFAVGELEMTECPSDDTLITIVWNDNYYKTTVEVSCAVNVSLVIVSTLYTLWSSIFLEDLWPFGT